MRPVPKDPNHPTDAEELAAEQWDCEDETAGYLMSQRLPDSVILDIRDFTTTREQWDTICHRLFNRAGPGSHDHDSS